MYVVKTIADSRSRLCGHIQLPTGGCFVCGLAVVDAEHVPSVGTCGRFMAS